MMLYFNYGSFNLNLQRCVNEVMYFYYVVLILVTHVTIVVKKLLLIEILFNVTILFACFVIHSRFTI